MTRKVLLVITGIFLLTAVFSGCMQSTVQPSQPTEDEVLLSQGLKVLSDGNIENKNQALEAFRKSCELGNNYGCHKTGIAYNNGLYGLSKDYQQALQWYLKAAEKGYIPSQQNIANLYAHRLLESSNDIEGYKWLKLAEDATQKCTKGTIEVERDITDEERRRLCQLAAAGQGRIRSIFRKRMSKEEIHQAEQMAISWRSTSF